MKVKYSCNRWWPWLTAIIAIAVLFSMLPALVLASPGEEPPVETVYNVTFHSSGESMWMEGTAPDDFLNETIPIISESWYESGSTGYITEIAGSDFGGRIGGSTSGSINLAVDFYDFGSGSVEIDYPVQVKLVTPGANSFKPGDTVTIESSVDLLPDWQFSVTPPNGTMDINAGFGLGSSAWAKICMFSCTEFNLIPPFDYSVYGPIVSADFADPITIEWWETLGHGISGSYGLPVVETTASLEGDGKSLTASGTRNFVDLNIDLDSWANKMGMPIPLGLHSPEIGGAQAGYEIVDVSVNLDMTQSHQFEFEPTVEVSFQFPGSVQYTVKTQSGSVVATGNSALVEFDAGHSVDIVYPETATDIFNVVPTFSLRNSFSNTATTTFTQDIAIKALELTLVIPGVDVIDEICFKAVKIRVWVPTPKWLDPFDGYWKWVTIVPAFCTPGPGDRPGYPGATISGDTAD